MSDKTHVNLRVLVNDLNDLIRERDYLAAELGRAKRRIEQYEKVQDALVTVGARQMLSVNSEKARDPEYMLRARHHTDRIVARMLGEEAHTLAKKETFPQPGDPYLYHQEERRATLYVIPPDVKWPHRGEY